LASKLVKKRKIGGENVFLQVSEKIAEKKILRILAMAARILVKWFSQYVQLFSRSNLAEKKVILISLIHVWT
jgi:hypothetical protein